MTDGKNIKELIKQVLQEIQDDEPRGYEADMEPDPRLNMDLNQEQAFEIVDFTPGYGDFVLKELFNNNFFEGSYIAGNISWLGPIPDCNIDDLKAELKEYAKMDQEQFNPIDNLENLINDQESEDEDEDEEDFYMDEELEDTLDESGYKRKGTLVKEGRMVKAVPGSEFNIKKGEGKLFDIYSEGWSDQKKLLTGLTEKEVLELADIDHPNDSEELFSVKKYINAAKKYGDLEFIPLDAEKVENFKKTKEESIKREGTLRLEENQTNAQPVNGWTISSKSNKKNYIAIPKKSKGEYSVTFSVVNGKPKIDGRSPFTETGLKKIYTWIENDLNIEETHSRKGTLVKESVDTEVDLEDEIFAMDYPLAVKLLRVLVNKYPDTEVSDYASDILITADELGDDYNDLQEADVKDALFQLMTIADEIQNGEDLEEASCNLTEDSQEYKTFNKGDAVIILDNVDGFGDPEDWGMGEGEYERMLDIAENGEIGYIESEETDGYWNVKFDDGFEIIGISDYHIELAGDQGNQVEYDIEVEESNYGSNDEEMTDRIYAEIEKLKQIDDEWTRQDILEHLYFLQDNPEDWNPGGFDLDIIDKVITEIEDVLTDSDFPTVEEESNYGSTDDFDEACKDVVRGQISVLIDDEGIESPDEIFATIVEMYENGEILDYDGQPIPVSTINEVFVEMGISDTIEETISIGSMGQPGTAGQGTNSGGATGNSAIQPQPFRLKKKKIIQENYEEDEEDLEDVEEGHNFKYIAKNIKGVKPNSIYEEPYEDNYFTYFALNNWDKYAIVQEDDEINLLMIDEDEIGSLILTLSADLSDNEIIQKIQERLNS